MKRVLVALNAQYVHTNLAVRSIAATLRAGGLPVTIAEYTINQRPVWVLRQLAAQKADVYLFSCYIWNIDIVCGIAADLRKLLPGALLVAGGPQVSYHGEEFLRQNPAFNLLVQGEGEESCLHLLDALQKGETYQTLPGLVLRSGLEVRQNPPARPPAMDSLPFAYEDLPALEGRILYYESMRGCPFGCSYCLSSVQPGVRVKSLPLVLEELQRLLAAKPRQVKFVDRTFNCNKEHAMAIWRYLQQRDNGVTNFHFELAGELLDEEMLRFLEGVRPGLFQFEIGVQSTNTETLREIDRFFNLEALFNKVEQLKKAGNIHLHLDLIAGLPYEDYESFHRSFDALYAHRPHQLQLGFLKVLAGSKMEQKAAEYGLVWQAAAPFEVLYTRWLTYEELCELHSVADMVEHYYNSARFSHIVEHLCARFASPFEFYSQLYATYLAQGHDTAPLSKLGYYELLGCFIQRHAIADTSRRAQWLCKYDMALHEKIKKLPAWVAVDMTAPLQNEILSFYKEAENIRRFLPAYVGWDAKQIRKNAHIEIFPFAPETGKEGTCAVLFDYTRRDLLGRARVADVSFWFLGLPQKQ